MASKDLKRPNILFILSDDQGAWAMGCAGNTDINTPHLDRLASSGIRFSNFFCTSPVCSPARASILTGQIPSQHGVQDFIRQGNNSELPHDSTDIEYLSGIDSYIDVLSRYGYDCGLSGKWHLGSSSQPQMNFSYWNVHATGAGNYYDAPMIIDGEFTRENKYITDVITNNGISFLEDNLESAKPFCLNVHYTAPHAPWDRENHPAETFNHYYENCTFDSVPWEETHPLQMKKDNSSAIVGHTDETRRTALSGYFSAITEMDRNIGRIVDWLENNDLRENTLIVFNADNGMNMGHHGIWGKGNGTYPPNMFDTAVKVPTIISRPGHVPEDLICDKLLSQYDFYPTILNYVGIENNSSENLPGRNFANLLRGKTLSNKEIVHVFDEYGPTRMIRSKYWKYIHRYGDGNNELYDLVRDSDESVNMIDAPHLKELAETLFEEMDAWYKKYTCPEFDGTNQNVKGRGQLSDLGSQGESFAQDIVYFDDLQE